MSYEPDFSRLRCAVLRQGEPDRVPLVEASVHPDVKAAFMGKPIDSLETEVEFWATAGYDYVPVQVGFRTMLRPSLSGPKQGTRANLRLYKTAHARYSLFTDEYEERHWAEEGRGVITTPEEFESFPWPRAEELDYSIFDQVARYLPPKMKVMAVLGWIYTPVWWLMGFEGFCEALTQQPSLVARLFEKVGTIQYQVMEIVARFDCVGGFWMPDDIAYTEGLMVAPKHLRQHVFPWYQRMGAFCREKGLLFTYHSDGRLYQVLENIIACGFQGLHPIEPKAMDIVQLKQTVGHRLCLMGNIDLSYTLTRGTPKEVEAEVKERLRALAPGGGYCVGSSNSVTEYVPLENYNAMREAVLKYGRYPISL